MKLRKLHIEDYKMFKDFDISFVDENDEALPIVVLAGVNGSGKTSLLEYIYTFIDMLEKKNQSYIEVERINNEIFIFNFEGITNFNLMFKKFQTSMAFDPRHPDPYNLLPYPHKNYAYFKNNFIYLSTQSSVKDIKLLLPKYIEDMIFVKGKAPFDAYKEVTEYMNDILKDLSTQIEFDSRDGEGNLFFRNKGGEDKFSIDDLSTGEKTLISKVLYLYLEDIKDKVILIDEPELSLHPSWQNKVLKIYENFALKNNCQIIIATHSPHIIASAKNEYLRFLIKEDNKIVVKQLSDSPLNRDTNTILKTLMGANYKPTELEELQLKYRELFDEGKLETEEAKEIEQKILQFESINSSFFQGIAFDKALMG